MSQFMRGVLNHGKSGKCKLTYNPAFDGIRAFAVLVVMLFHARVPGFKGGGLKFEVQHLNLR